MIIESATAVAAMGGIAGVVAVYRARHYRQLAATLGRVKSDMRGWTRDLLPHQPRSFEKSIAVIPGFLPEARFEELRRDVETLAGAERSYVPIHKKGGTVAYETIIERVPALAAFYHSEALRRLVSRTVGVEVVPTPLHDQSSLSILVYDRPGDHIGWHYDHNFYRGRHFTVLLPVVNAGSAERGMSHARLWATIDGIETKIDAEPNTLVLFEGARVLHKVSPLIAGERRVVVSMTYCADPHASRVQAVARRVKDTAFFGIRALWT